jgi:hypothetical protein
MDIRLTLMMSIFATVLVVSGCASTEETRPASGPSMKEIPSAKEMPPAKMKETPPPTVTKEPTPAKRHRDPHRHEQRSASSVSSGDIKRSFTGSACGRRTDVPT